MEKLSTKPTVGKTNGPKRDEKIKVPTNFNFNQKIKDDDKIKIVTPKEVKGKDVSKIKTISDIEKEMPKSLTSVITKDKPVKISVEKNNLTKTKVGKITMPNIKTTDGNSINFKSMSANDIESKLPTGSKNLSSGDGKTLSTKIKVKADNIKDHNDSEIKNVSRNDKIIVKKHDAIKITDNMIGVKAPKVKTDGNKVYESNIILNINGKPKATYNIISKKVLKTLVENYKNIGFTMSYNSTGKKEIWKESVDFKKFIMNAVDAKYNKLDNIYKSNIKEAYNILYSMYKNDFDSSLYESKNDFDTLIKIKLSDIIKEAINSYNNKLKIFYCNASLAGKKSVEIVIEAIDADTAARLSQSTIIENYGFDKIKSIVIDGEKYGIKDIPVWKEKY